MSGRITTFSPSQAFDLTFVLSITQAAVAAPRAAVAAPPRIRSATLAVSAQVNALTKDNTLVSGGTVVVGIATKVERAFAVVSNNVRVCRKHILRLPASSTLP